MGRGRQKAKQQKIARKLKYLTTDTDYDELAKELGATEPGTGSFDPFADAENAGTEDYDEYDAAETGADDDLDDYAKWAAEAAAKATSAETAGHTAAAKPHKPIPMPMPGSWKHGDAKAAGDDAASE